MNKALKNIIILFVCLISGGTAVAQMSYIVPLPLPPSPITGPTCVTCINHPSSLTYSVVNNPDVTYEWTLPAGWTQVSGGNTNSITVKPPDYNPSDILGYIGKVSISVVAKNDFGVSIPSVLSGINFQNIPMPTFASYNLGADPTLDTPKKQMQYLAIPTNATTRVVDGRVFGGRYQWGRDNAGNYAINPSTYALSVGEELSNKQTRLAQNATYDANGQILTNPDTTVNFATYRADTVFISTNVNPYDWRLSSPNGGQKNDLWGNGFAITSQTSTLPDKGIKTSNGSFYQSTSWVLPQNNPCATLGQDWRVPTQDELERLINYECNGQNGAGSFSTISVSVPTTALWGTTNTGFTWVRVANGAPVLNTWTSGNGNGYAVYRTDVWNAAIAAGGYFEGLQKDGTGLSTVFNTKKLYDTGAPEPFLFLPTALQRQQSGTVNTASTSMTGNYLSATIWGTNAYPIYFTNISIGMSAQAYRGTGNSIRCVK